jgi:DNA repair protein RAD7
LLQDSDAAKLIDDHASTLQSLAFQSCPLLGKEVINCLQTKFEGGHLLELSLQDMRFSEEDLETLAASKESLFKGMKSLTLKSVDGLTDDILMTILEAVGESLDSLNIAYNYELTDTTLSSIRQFNPCLRTLVMDGVKELTSAGLEVMFTHPLEGLPPPPKLKVLKLNSVDHQAVTDEVLRLVTASAIAGDSAARKGTGLVQLDVQGSSLVTDTMLEQLVETSSTTLEELNVSNCPLITSQGLGYLVSKTGKQLKKISVWGCAQLNDEFFDGHDRVQDRTLEIIGAWMKKSGTRSLR